MFNFLKRLFSRKKIAASVEIKTTPLSDQKKQELTAPLKTLSSSNIITGSAQSVGRQRDHNEDTLFFHESKLLVEGFGEIPVGIYIIADGMGGHLHGEVASGVAVQVIGKQLIEQIKGGNLRGDRDKGETIQETLEKAFNAAQAAVQRDAPGGGTTLTTALMIGEQVTFAHVGDSRAYFIYSNASMKALTQDHSLVRRLVELGQLTEEQAKDFPQKNVLYKAVGQPEPIRADIFTYQVPRPGYLMLCSDGLWGVVEEEQILRIILSAPTPMESSRLLVDAANNAGGPDNISVILVQFL